MPVHNLGKKVYAHKMVADIACKMAAAIYDECAKLNEWYALNPSQSAFIRRVAPDLIEQAKLTLVDMLQSPSTSEAQKEAIYDALMKHGALPQNTARTTTH